jgi:hypothetical protein
MFTGGSRVDFGWFSGGFRMNRVCATRNPPETHLNLITFTCFSISLYLTKRKGYHSLFYSIITKKHKKKSKTLNPHHPHYHPPHYPYQGLQLKEQQALTPNLRAAQRGRDEGEHKLPQ